MRDRQLAGSRARHFASSKLAESAGFPKTQNLRFHTASFGPTDGNNMTSLRSRTCIFVAFDREVGLSYSMAWVVETFPLLGTRRPLDSKCTITLCVEPLHYLQCLIRGCTLCVFEASRTDPQIITIFLNELEHLHWPILPRPTMPTSYGHSGKQLL